METTGDLVATTAKLPARMEDSQHGLQRRLAGAGMDVGGNAAAVVPHLGGAVAVEMHTDFRAVPRQGLVHGVVHHFVDQVVQPPGTGAADVHARTFAHRLQPFKDLDLRCAVVRLNLAGLSHGSPAHHARGGP